MEFSKYIACICEGTAEQVIINILLDNNKLIFDRKNLLEEDVLRSRSGQKIWTAISEKRFWWQNNGIKDPGFTKRKLQNQQSLPT